MADLGLKSGTVKLVDYNPSWRVLYEAEAEELAKALEIPRSKIQHVGSTSIPGTLAKPILDIAVLVDSLKIVDEWKTPLKKIGYWYKGVEKDLPDRRFFAKGPRSNRTVYLHVVNPREYESLLRFRDTLRGDSQLVHEYSNLKQKLAMAHPGNRDEYTRSKNDFIRRILGYT